MSASLSSSGGEEGNSHVTDVIPDLQIIGPNKEQYRDRSTERMGCSARAMAISC